MTEEKHDIAGAKERPHEAAQNLAGGLDNTNAFIANGIAQTLHMYVCQVCDKAQSDFLLVRSFLHTIHEVGQRPRKEVRAAILRCCEPCLPKVVKPQKDEPRIVVPGTH